MGTTSGKALIRAIVLALFAAGAFCYVLTRQMEPVLAADDDGDGVSNAMELIFGTDSGSSDTDQDNLSDFDEIFVYGTSPTMPDTDGDGTNDDTDTNPLDDGSDAGGRTTPSTAFSSNLSPASLVGTTPTAGYDVTVHEGGLETPLAVISFGEGTTYAHYLVLRYLSGTTHNGRWGRNVYSNWDEWATYDSQTQDVSVYFQGRKMYFGPVTK